MSSKESSPNISEIRNNNVVVKEGTLKRKSSKTNFFRHTWESVYCIVRQVQTGASIEFYNNYTVYINKEEEPIDIFIVDPGLKAKKKDKEFGTLSQRFNVLTTANSVVALKATNALEAEEWLAAINGCFKFNRINSFDKLEAITDSLNEVVHAEVRSLSPTMDNNSNKEEEEEELNNSDYDEKKDEEVDDEEKVSKTEDNFHNRVLKKLSSKQPETSRKATRRGPRHYSQFRPQTSRVASSRINTRGGSGAGSSTSKRSTSNDRSKSSLKSSTSPKRLIRKPLPKYHSLPSNISKHLTNVKHKQMNSKHHKTIGSARASGNRRVTSKSNKSLSPSSKKYNSMRRSGSDNNITRSSSPKASKSRERISSQPQKTLLSGHLPRRQMSPTNKSSRKKVRRRIARSASMGSNVEDFVPSSTSDSENTSEVIEGEDNNKILDSNANEHDDIQGETRRIDSQEGIINDNKNKNSQQNVSPPAKKRNISSPTNKSKHNVPFKSKRNASSSSASPVKGSKSKENVPVKGSKSKDNVPVKGSKSKDNVTSSPVKNSKSKSKDNVPVKGSKSKDNVPIKGSKSKDNVTSSPVKGSKSKDNESLETKSMSPKVPGLPVGSVNSNNIVYDEDDSDNNNDDNDDDYDSFENGKRPKLDPLTPRRVNYLRKIAQWKKDKPQEELNSEESEDSLSFVTDGSNDDNGTSNNDKNKSKRYQHRAVSMGDIRSKIVKSESSNNNVNNDSSKGKSKLSHEDRRKSQERILRTNEQLDERRQVQSAFREKLLSMKRISICLNTKMSSFLRYKRNLNRFMYCLPIEEDDRSAPLEATFCVVPGFVDGDTTCIAFECVDKSGHGHFLRHTGPQKGLKMEDVGRFVNKRGKSWTKDCSWRVTPAIDLAERLGLCDTPESKANIEEKYGQSDMVALESVNKGNHFCRHKNTEIVLGKAELTLNFLEDSTFRIVQPLYRGGKKR